MNRPRLFGLIAVVVLSWVSVIPIHAQAPSPAAVLVVIGPDEITFEGESIDWDALQQRLEAVPERGTVIMQLAISTDEITLGELKTARMRLTELGEELGFRSVVYVGEREAGARATPLPLDTVEVSQDPDAEFQSIQQALDALRPGGLLKIGPGRYEERVVIRQPVRIEGAGWEQTTIAGPEWRRPSDEIIESFRERMEAATTDEERERIEAEARSWMEEFGRSLSTPVVQILGADEFSCTGVKFSLPGIPRENSGLPGVCVMRIQDSVATLEDCAVIGSPGNGIEVNDGSQFEISNCLVAAIWNTGIAVGDTISATISDCDIRNCYHRCVTLGTGETPCVVRRCRISGSAWHGIRYDGSSPTIEHNIISRSARSGIYASGSTGAVVRNNLFQGNEMNGISCWFDNRDTIERNTFAANLREAIAIVGASQPTIRHNVVSGSPVGVTVGPISGDGALSEPVADRNLTHNWFWNNEQNLVVAARDADTGEFARQTIAVADEGEDNREGEPGYADPDEGDFSLTDDSPARADEVGAADFPALASPWPLQPEEQAIIPRTATRDWNAWRRPE